MPVKVRCECGHAMAVPDAARGKTIKCKSCGSPVRVPAGEGGAAAPRRKKAAEPQVSPDDEDFLNRLNLDEAEHAEIQLCPKCATKVKPDDIECPGCGINLETGQLSAKRAYKKKRGGADPDLYYRAAWVDSWAFLKKNWTLGLRLAVFMSFGITLFFASLFMTAWCVKIPLRVFWGVMTLVSIMASVGSYLQLWLEIVKATVAEKDELTRFNFDFFTCAALGFKAVIWSVAIGYMFWAGAFVLLMAGLAAGMITPEDGNSPIVLGVVLGLYYLPYLCWPVAVAHLAAKYSWKAYIPYHMIRLTFKNFLPVAWFWLIAIVIELVAVGLSVAAGWWNEELLAQMTTWTHQLMELCDIETAEQERGFLYHLMVPCVGLPMLFILLVPVCAASAIPFVMLMRANGLLARYWDRELETSHKVVANQVAGFWIRYLAFLADQCVIFTFACMSGVVFGGLWGMASFLEIDLGQLPRMGFTLTTTGAAIAYFMFSESGPSAATMGMKSMGLIVVTQDYKRPITRGQALSRYFARGLSGLFFGAGFLLMLFDKEGQTLHDKLTKTRVVWRGEVH